MKYNILSNNDDVSSIINLCIDLSHKLISQGDNTVL
jgi:hypothetical protein